MKKHLLALIATACLVTPLQAAEYKIDPSHSFVEFSISHLGFSVLKGRFNTLEGRFSYDEKEPAKAQVTATVDTGSLDSNHAERDKHLKSADFLDVSQYPTATFKSTSFLPSDDQKGVLEGELTLHGVSKVVKLEVEFIGAGDDPWGGYRRGYVGRTTLKRADFGISRNLGPAAETLSLDLFIEGIRQ